MKVPIDDYACLDWDAPTLPVKEVAIDGVARWRVWCKHCQSWHFHSPAKGHREAHCHDSASLYWQSGYNLALIVEDE